MTLNYLSNSGDWGRKVVNWRSLGNLARFFSKHKISFVDSAQWLTISQFYFTARKKSPERL